MDTIDQFMWGYQKHFRLSVEFALERALETIGASALRPRVSLVGFHQDASRPYPICVEPETGRLQPEHLAIVRERAADLRKGDPEADMLHSHPVAQALHDERVSRRAWVNAVLEAVDASGVYPGRGHFATQGADVDGCEVFIVAGIDATVLASISHLHGEAYDRIRVPRSLVAEVIHTTLTAASRDLHLPDPGAGVGVSQSTFDIIREAGIYFTAACSVRIGNPFGSDLFSNLNNATALTYEGAQAAGYMILAREAHPDITSALHFQHNVSLSRSRAVRKLLEMTGDGLSLLTDGQVIYGLGSYDVAKYKEAQQDLFEIHIPDHATWELAHRGTQLIRVSFGKSTLPAPKVDRRRYDDTMQRVFADSDVLNIDTIWRLVEAATSAAHGTMLVISPNAASEAVRLSSQATLIDASPIDATLMSRISAIDGAVLIDHSGTCHAIGVILDGVATDSGDPARGARYNSAIRYLKGRPDDTVIIIVSEDGGVNLVPQLHPRIRRSRVVDTLDYLKTVAGAEADRETFNRAWEEVEALAFYLDRAQCEEANALRDVLEDTSLAKGYIKIIFSRLTPSTLMNESYWVDDEGADPSDNR
jgi:hypothetical protein